MKLVSVVLSGGAGTRLWPASRQGYPKPFMKLGGSTPAGAGHLPRPGLRHRRTAGGHQQDHLFLTKDVSSPSCPIRPSTHYLLEPKGRNTGPAIALAALHCAQAYRPRRGAAGAARRPPHSGRPSLRGLAPWKRHSSRSSGQLVVFGIHPTGPDTGFGYIEVEHVSRESQRVLRFVEKPDLATAQEYLATGRYYWNSGMFCFTAHDHVGRTGAACAACAGGRPQSVRMRARPSADATRFDAHAFGLQPDISIDYAVMEKADNVTVVPAKFGWSDVGSWPAVAQAHTADASGNTFIADVVAVDTRAPMCRSKATAPRWWRPSACKDLVVVDTPDALLVAHKSGAQKIKIGGRYPQDSQATRARNSRRWCTGRGARMPRSRKKPATRSSASL